MTLAELGSLLVSQVLPIIIVSMVAVIVSRVVFGIEARVVHKYSFTQEAVESDNPAVLIRLAGMLFATIVAFIGIAKPSGLGWLYDMAVLGESLVTVIVLLWISMWVNDKCILSKVSNTAEVVGKRNTAVGIIEASTLAATAFIFSGAFAGSEDKFTTEVVWFALGQGLLVTVAYLYRFVVPNAADEIANQNTAVAFSMGGLLIAAGMALGGALTGQFESWTSDLLDVVLYVGIWLFVMTVLRLVVNYIIIPGARMRKEMTADRNWGVGFVDGTLSVAITVMFVHLAG
ncbi:MAG: DUF350 domain-containing protein [Parcubacteria group bacterium]|nr:DUF350 domain-containing protein [Parcubacteria group bacterium]